MARLPRGGFSDLVSVENEAGDDSKGRRLSLGHRPTPASTGDFPLAGRDGSGFVFCTELVRSCTNSVPFRANKFPVRATTSRNAARDLKIGGLRPAPEGLRLKRQSRVGALRTDFILSVSSPSFTVTRVRSWGALIPRPHQAQGLMAPTKPSRSLGTRPPPTRLRQKQAECGARSRNVKSAYTVTKKNGCTAPKKGREGGGRSVGVQIEGRKPPQTSMASEPRLHHHRGRRHRMGDFTTRPRITCLATRAPFGAWVGGGNGRPRRGLRFSRWRGRLSAGGLGPEHGPFRGGSGGKMGSSGGNDFRFFTSPELRKLPMVAEVGLNRFSPRHATVELGGRRRHPSSRAGQGYGRSGDAARRRETKKRARS